MIAAIHAIDSQCPMCGHVGSLRLHWRNEEVLLPTLARPAGSRVIKWPWAICEPEHGGCGIELKGKRG